VNIIKKKVLKLSVIKISPKEYTTTISISREFFNLFIEDLNKTEDQLLQLSQALPMIFPPASWKDFNRGAYYLKPSLVIRSQFKPHIGIIQRSDMRRIYQSKFIFMMGMWDMCPFILHWSNFSN
jgi:DNA-directed RNA polymerase